MFTTFYVCERAQPLSRVWLSATPWTVAHQAPLSKELSRQEYWSGWPFPAPGDLPDPGMEPEAPAASPAPQMGSLSLSHRPMTIHHQPLLGGHAMECTVVTSWAGGRRGTATFRAMAPSRGGEDEGLAFQARAAQQGPRESGKSRGASWRAAAGPGHSWSLPPCTRAAPSGSQVRPPRRAPAARTCSVDRSQEEGGQPRAARPRHILSPPVTTGALCGQTGRQGGELHVGEHRADPGSD